MQNLSQDFLGQWKIWLPLQNQKDFEWSLTSKMVSLPSEQTLHFILGVQQLSHCFLLSCVHILSPSLLLSPLFSPLLFLSSSFSLALVLLSLSIPPLSFSLSHQKTSNWNMFKTFTAQLQQKTDSHVAHGDGPLAKWGTAGRADTRTAEKELSVRVKCR